jgi:hypothetical protein
VVDLHDLMTLLLSPIATLQVIASVRFNADA